MISSDEILILVAGIIVLGFIGEIAFRKWRIPDMLILILIGIALHYSHIIPKAYLSTLEQFLGLFGTVALTLIVFGSVLKIDISKYGKAVTKGIIVGIMDVLSVVGILTPLMYLVLKIPLTDSLLLSAVLGGTSAVFVISLLSRLKIDDELNHVIEIETVFNSILNIIVVLVFLNILSKSSSYIGVTGYLFSTVSEGIILGGVTGILWLILLKQAKVPHYYMVTVGILFGLWAISDYFNASPILSVFIFSIIIANSESLSKVLKISGSLDIKKLLTFNDEISFFILTFFYVYIGIFVNIFDYKAFLSASVIVAFLYIIKYTEVFAIDKVTKWFGHLRILLGSFAQRGETVIVLMGVLLSLDPQVFDTFANTTFFIVIESILVGVVLYTISSRGMEVKKE